VQYAIEKLTDDSAWHCHDTAILGFLESGLLGIRTKQESVVLAAGTISFIPPRTPHFEKAFGTAVSGWYVTIPENQCKSLPGHACTLELSDLLVALCKRIASWGDGKGRTNAQNRLTDTLLDEIRHARIAKGLSIPFPKKASLRAIAKRIMVKPQDMHRIGHWAKAAGMSRRSFTRHFSKETGLPFSHWRKRVKFHAGLIKLAGGSSVTEVAFDLGYRNVSTFIAIFRKQFGVSPLRYINRQKNRRSGQDRRASGRLRA
jgi:AraC-like DNA-binding protein